jgi:hypothetical protein
MKGYKLLDLHTHSTFISRDVVFQESIFPYTSSIPSHTSISNENLVIHHFVPDFDDLNQFGSNSHNTSTTELPIQTLEPIESISSTCIPCSHNTPRKSSRIRKQPSYLHDFHYQLASSFFQLNPISLDMVVNKFSGTSYSLSSPLSYDKLSNSHKYFSLFVSSNFKTQFYHQAIKHPHWCEAMQVELIALEENHTWSLLDLPPHKKPIGCKWVIERYKARLGAKAYTQCEGIDYHETFSHVAKLSIVRCFLTSRSLMGLLKVQSSASGKGLHSV